MPDHQILLDVLTRCLHEPWPVTSTSPTSCTSSATPTAEGYSARQAPVCHSVATTVGGAALRHRQQPNHHHGRERPTGFPERPLPRSVQHRPRRLRPRPQPVNRLAKVAATPPSASDSVSVAGVAHGPGRDPHRLAQHLRRQSPRTGTATTTAAVEVLANMATAYVAHASELDQVRRTNEQLQAALDGYAVLIEQAKGILAGERNMTLDEAFGGCSAPAPEAITSPCAPSPTPSYGTRPQALAIPQSPAPSTRASARTARLPARCVF